MKKTSIKIIIFYEILLKIKSYCLNISKKLGYDLLTHLILSISIPSLIFTAAIANAIAIL